MKPKKVSIFVDKISSAEAKKFEKASRSVVAGEQLVKMDLRSSFFSCLVDMYSHPDMIELRFPPHGKQQRLHNTKRIRSYFAKSLGGF